MARAILLSPTSGHQQHKVDHHIVHTGVGSDDMQRARTRDLPSFEVFSRHKSAIIPPIGGREGVRGSHLPSQVNKRCLKTMATGLVIVRMMKRRDTNWHSLCDLIIKLTF